MREICPICKERVKVAEPNRGGTVVHKKKRYHFHCYYDNYETNKKRKEDRVFSPLEKK